MRDATRLLAGVEDRRRLALGTRALLVACEFVPDEPWAPPLRAALASVVAEAEAVVERPGSDGVRSRLRLALDLLRREIDRAAGRAG